ncbi:MAG: hypothetical protein AB1724_02160 [Thermodesulfobacteriota bacterium]
MTLLTEVEGGVFDLFSFQNISNSNGWAFAALGISIDIAGLAILSLIVSRVPRLVALLEKIGSLLKKAPVQPRKKQTVKSQPDNLLAAGINDLATVYKSLTDPLGDVFQLSEVYRAAEENGLPHPHLTIKALRESGMLVSEGNGLFRWRR